MLHNSLLKLSTGLQPAALEVVKDSLDQADSPTCPPQDCGQSEICIVLTHFHEDHAGSAAEIAQWGDLEIVAGALDAPFVSGVTRGPLPNLTASERTIHADSEDPPHGPPCRVDRGVRDGDLLDFAGGTRIIEVPGHTPGSIALFLPGANAVVTGDAVAEFNGEVILGVFNTDREAARRSLEQITATKAQIAGFGHGNPILKDAYRLIRTAKDPFAA